MDLMLQAMICVHDLICVTMHRSVGPPVLPVPLQVLNIVTLGDGHQGGFFPQGLNGVIA
jgi:hypothetical protein